MGSHQSKPDAIVTYTLLQDGWSVVLLCFLFRIRARFGIFSIADQRRSGTTEEFPAPEDRSRQQEQKDCDQDSRYPVRRG